jgi:hypothetical protein
MPDTDSIYTYASWWPVSVLLPDRTTIWHRVRVYATTAGLVIYRQRPTGQTPEWGSLTPDWFSPVDYAANPRPAASQLPGSSISLTTQDGLVTITFTGGCGCGNPLKTWRPSFSTRVQAWPASAVPA